jgi:hypothetical protein
MEERSFDAAFRKMWELYRSLPDARNDNWRKAAGF